MSLCSTDRAWFSTVAAGLLLGLGNSHEDLVVVELDQVEGSDHKQGEREASEHRPWPVERVVVPLGARSAVGHRRRARTAVP